mmetsp:Transcript_26838/g.80139  ORF Transcript_26838/g.80139 Transcript_26838/m.80139 type:complete len:267 (+) Transcript_26838:114-914(+)
MPRPRRRARLLFRERVRASPSPASRTAPCANAQQVSSRAGKRPRAARAAQKKRGQCGRGASAASANSQPAEPERPPQPAATRRRSQQTSPRRRRTAAATAARSHRRLERVAAAAQLREGHLELGAIARPQRRLDRIHRRNGPLVLQPLPVLIDEDGAVSLKAVPVAMQLQPAPVVPHLVAAVRVPARHRGAAHCVVVHIPQDLLDVGLALFGLEHVVHARPGRRLGALGVALPPLGVALGGVRRAPAVLEADLPRHRALLLLQRVD